MVSIASVTRDLTSSGMSDSAFFTSDNVVGHTSGQFM